jgi:phytanoyl-CoA dioxygenase PhyH
MAKLQIPAFHLEDKLNAEQINFFKKYGIIQFKNFINKETVNLFLSEIDKTQNFLLGNQIKKVNGIPLKFGKDIDGSPLIQRIAFTSLYSKVLSDFLKNDRLQNLLELLGKFQGRIGENEKDGLVFNHYVNDNQSSFKQLGWHTDSPRDLFLGSRILPMLNIGLHLDDCCFESGGLRVIPGTHEQGLFKLLFRKKYYIDNSKDNREVGFDIEAGDLTVHDGRLWHRVQQSNLPGEKSRRRVMYIPVVTGPYHPKHAASPTPFYHKIGELAWSKNFKPKLAFIKDQLRDKYSGRDLE